MSPVCKTHKTFTTREDAQRWCDALTEFFGSIGAGKSYRHLHVFYCDGHFHVGRGKKSKKYKPKPAKVKAPSAGALRRKAAREAKAAVRHARRKLAYLEKLVIQEYGREAERLTVELFRRLGRQ